MKQFLFSIKFLVPASILIALIALISGLILDPFPFLGNLLAEIVGVVLGILIVYFIVERLLRSQKEKERRNIRAFTQISISLDILFIINKFCITIPITGSQPLLGSIGIDISIRKGAISKDTIDLLEQYLNSIHANLPNLVPNITDKQVSDFYDAIEPNINYITDVLVPRIIEFSEGHNLNEIFVVFEKMLINARNDYPLYKQGIVSKEKMFEFALSVLTGSKNVLSSISKRIKF